MKTLYLDLFSGVSGDMLLGALIDLGADARKLERELKKLKLKGYHLHVARRQKSQIEGVKFEVHLAEDHDHEHAEEARGARREGQENEHAHGHEHHPAGVHGHDQNDSARTFADIRKLIERSRLSGWVKHKSIAVFRRIAEAEGKIHGHRPEDVHFHEVGAVDSIVDIVGACIALELLGKPRVLASPVIEGVGWVDCAHGRFPVPAPATLAILGARGVGITQCDEPHELVTPTGAALLAEFAEDFGSMSGLVAERIGIGVGTRENRSRPNVLRAVLTAGRGEGRGAKSGKHDWETDTVAVLETNLDDINAEILGAFVERAFTAGALDVFHTPVQMKKNRPGVLLTVLCPEAEADKFSKLILCETSAFGVRRHLAERRKLRRDFCSVKTRFGRIMVKLGRLDDKIVQAAPEFESCQQAAARAKVPLKEIYEEVARVMRA